MANIMNKFLDIMKLGGEENDYDEDFYEEEEQEEAPSTFRNKRESSSKRFNDIEEETPKRERTITRSERAPKLVPMQSGRKKGMGVSIQKPNSFEDSEVICDMLLKGQAVVVNLEGFNPHDAQRIMDFLSGCIYAMDGKLNQIAKYIFLFSPDNVDVSGDLTFDSNGVPIFNREF